MVLETVLLFISRLARLLYKSSPWQWWKAGWFSRPFTWQNLAFSGTLRVQVLLIKWKMLFLLIMQHTLSCCLWILLLTQKKKKKKKERKKYCAVLLYKSQTPLERALYISQWQREDLKFEMQDWEEFSINLSLPPFFFFLVIHPPSATPFFRVKILKVSHLDS